LTEQIEFPILGLFEHRSCNAMKITYNSECNSDTVIPRDVGILRSINRIATLSGLSRMSSLLSAGSEESE